MKGIAARFVGFGPGLLCLITVGWVLAGSAAPPVLAGLPTDWTHRHVIFSQPATTEQAILLAEEPRFWQQEYRRSALRVVSDGMPDPDEANSLGLALKGVSTARVHRDWSQDMGGPPLVGAGNSPAKYGFHPNFVSCASPGPPDFVVFGTGLFGSPTQAAIVAYDNLYSGCNGTVPQAYWAYNLNGGLIPTSPVFSQDGTQLAFTGTNGSGIGHFVLLTWKSSTTETVSSPLPLGPLGTFAYPGCSAPCMTTIALTNGSGNPTDNTASSVFYDYGPDIAWVGDKAGWLHQFHPVFSGVPAEIRTGGWPVQVNPSAVKPALSNPVHDQVSHKVFVGDMSGFLAQVDDATGAVTLWASWTSAPA